MLTLLNENLPDQAFPAIDKALKEPDGLLAIGGCLSSKRLLNAYRQGIFPWFSPGEPILWWSPDPRLVVLPKHLHISKSLAKTIRKQDYRISFDQCFMEVMNACAETREQDSGTWISEDMKKAYDNLYQLGFAHSIEVWSQQRLVGGLYGVAIGQVFFGESMFHKQTDASKVAFVKLIEWLDGWDYQLVDCQVHTDHLVSLGAENIPRATFQSLLNQYCLTPAAENAWSLD